MNHAATTRRGRAPRGYTLIEVLVVVAIIGIAGAVVVPQMLKANSLTVQAAARMIIADLLIAQNEAVARSASRRVVFDVSSNSYRMTDAAGQTQGVAWKAGGAGSANYVVDFSGDSRFTGVRLAAVDFGGASAIEFDDLGAPSAGGSIDLVAGSLRYRITVAPFTGRVTIDPVTP